MFTKFFIKKFKNRILPYFKHCIKKNNENIKAMFLDNQFFDINIGSLF